MICFSIDGFGCTNKIHAAFLTLLCHFADRHGFRSKILLNNRINLGVSKDFSCSIPKVLNSIYTILRLMSNKAIFTTRDPSISFKINFNTSLHSSHFFSLFHSSFETMPMAKQAARRHRAEGLRWLCPALIGTGRLGAYLSNGN